MDKLATFLASIFALPVDTPAAAVNDAQALDYLLRGLGGSSGAGAMGIAVLITQVLLFLARSPLADLAGRWKLAIVTGVSLVATVVAGKVAGQTWAAALLSGPVVTAAQVFAHQLFAQFKPAPKLEAVPLPDHEKQ